MTKNIPESHKRIILEALETKKAMDEKMAVKSTIQEKVKNEAIVAIKDLKELKYHLKVMKDVASLFLSND